MMRMVIINLFYESVPILHSSKVNKINYFYKHVLPYYQISFLQRHDGKFTLILYENVGWKLGKSGWTYEIMNLILKQLRFILAHIRHLFSKISMI